MRLKGTITVDGGTYEVYAGTHDGPSIDPNVNHFNQYWSVRVDSQLRTEGTINIDKHFAAWENQFGMKMGGLHEVALNVEGWQSSGYATISKNDLSIGGGTSEEEDPPTPVEPDADGNYLKSTFEGSSDKWKGRGDAKVTNDTKNYYDGKSSLFVSGRTEKWHGAYISLDPSIFKPGNTYSFSVAALQKSGKDATMQLTLQQGEGSNATYPKIAEATAKSGEWTKLENAEFTIPTGSTNMMLYVESTDSLTDFYIDTASVGVSGNKSSIVTGKGVVDGAGSPDDPEPKKDVIRGDLNGDKLVDIFDLALARNYLLGTFSGGKRPENFEAADIDGDGDYSINDIVLLNNFLNRKINKFPEVTVTTTTTPKITETTTTTKAVTPSGNMTPEENMAYAKSIFTANVPDDIKSGTHNNVTHITYYSKKAGHDKPANVWLPPDYSPDKKYPVLYMNHGVTGGENDMVSGWSVCEMAYNLIKKGEVKPFIIVFPQMYTDPNAERPAGFNFTQAMMDHYDDFLYDLTESLMPYMEEHYSVATGRENTAIAGFSMGGRESLYIGMMACDKIGYVCAASPAPGILPTTDFFMTHRGSFTSESQFTFKQSPYVLMIGGGTNDNTVGTYPKEYHQIYDKNGVDNIWFEVQGAGHDNRVGTPLFYNFFRSIFRNN